MAITITKVRYDMSMRQLQIALEEIGLDVTYHPKTEDKVSWLEVWKSTE